MSAIYLQICMPQIVNNTTVMKQLYYDKLLAFAEKLKNGKAFRQKERSGVLSAGQKTIIN